MGYTNKHLPRRLGTGVVALGATLGLVLAGPAAQAASTYYQGFEEDTAGWYDATNAWSGSVTRVESGTNVDSAEGDWHAIMTEDPEVAGRGGPFSRFDGYRDEWPGDYTAEIDVYLDPSWDAGEGFDYSVASSNSSGGHLRDFIFHVASDTSTGDLLVGASNNTNFGVREDLDTLDNHGVIEEAGWYTLQHRFYDDNGVLAVDLNLIDSDGGVVFTETLSTAADTIPDAVGGNRYSWFTVINVDGGINVDAHELILPGASSKDQCKQGGWQDFGQQYKNQGQCVAATQSNENSRHHRG